MSYVVLARKWRPQQFKDVLGQAHVTTPLINAIEADRIAHAFLFSGPRGIGKTSAARILAKALCCETRDQPTPAPCGRCPQCVQITEGRSTDVFEIDAASHTGVDNVREIVDNVRYLPSSARFKIYVIDEVHMLSTGAFNALLKTLEEPPPHVKFVLATTDVHKVPVTILSRCQRYDFRRIALSAIQDRLSNILNSEGITHEASALSLVAREAEGSMRDAQSLLEQVLAFAGDRPLDGGLVREALGVVDGALVAEAVDALLARDPGQAIERVGDVFARGLDLSRFVEALLEQVRDLLVAKLVDKPARVLDRPDDEVRALVTRAKSIDTVDLERIFEHLARVADDVGRSEHARFTLEVGLAAVAEKPPAVPLDRLVAQLEALELQLGKVPPPGGGPPRGRRVGSTLGQGSSPVEASPAPGQTEPDPRVMGEGSPAGPGAPPLTEPSDLGTKAGREGFERWVTIVKKRRPSLAATLLQVRPLSFSVGGVRLGTETDFDRRKLLDRETRSALERLLAEFFGTSVSLEVTRAGEPAPPEEKSLTEIEDDRVRARRARKEQVAMDNPAVKAIAGELGGEIAKVRVLDEGEPR